VDVPAATAAGLIVVTLGVSHEPAAARAQPVALRVAAAAIVG
jgi:hypothetical protein